MSICTLNELLVAVIVPLACTSCEEIPLQSNINVSDGGQNPQSSFCVEMTSKVQVTLTVFTGMGLWICSAIIYTETAGKNGQEVQLKRQCTFVHVSIVLKHSIMKNVKLSFKQYCCIRQVICTYCML